MNVPMRRIIGELSLPEAFPDPVVSIEVLQTHISVIFLAGDRVYKVKKPVDFGFLDFTTLEKRRRFCEEELRLNRRLSPDTYLDVVPVTERDGLLRFGGTGPAVEYAVLMRRLDVSRLLSALLERDEVGPGDIARIAHKIAHFHLHADTSPEITHIGGTEAVVFNTEENFEQIEPYVGETLSPSTFGRIADYTRTFIRANRELLSRREKEGWVRDGHGDLHTQHICLADGIQIFDCIEFNQRFRYGDVLVDAAFLAMDLDRLGYGELAAHYRDTYLDLMGQKDQAALMNFYACYRAVVRGKVEGFRSHDPNVPPDQARAAAENARAFHLLAERYAVTLHPTTLLVACGLMGSGKSTLAHGLKELVEVEVLSSDRTRKELAGIDPATARRVAFGSDIYSREFTRKTYDELHRRALDLLRQGRSVFLDASYADPAKRAEALAVAREAGARAIVLHFDAAEEDLRARLRERVLKEGEASDGREEILAQQMEAFRPPEEVPEHSRLAVDTSAGSGDALRRIYRRVLSTT